MFYNVRNGPHQTAAGWSLSVVALSKFDDKKFFVWIRR